LVGALWSSFRQFTYWIWTWQFDNVALAMWSWQLGNADLATGHCWLCNLAKWNWGLGKANSSANSQAHGIPCFMDEHPWDIIHEFSIDELSWHKDPPWNTTWNFIPYMKVHPRDFIMISNREIWDYIGLWSNLATKFMAKLGYLEIA
jgi:hypothetical protein